MPQKTRADALKSRQAILDAVTEVFQEGAVLSKAGLARSAHVSRQTMHRHFPTNADLFVALQEHHYQDLVERAKRIHGADRIIPRMVVRHLVGEGGPFQARHLGILGLGHHPGCTDWAEQVQKLLLRAWPGSDQKIYPILAHALVGAALGWAIGSPRSDPKDFEEVLLTVISNLLFF